MTFSLFILNLTFGLFEFRSPIFNLEDLPDVKQASEKPIRKIAAVCSDAKIFCWSSYIFGYPIAKLVSPH